MKAVVCLIACLFVAVAFATPVLDFDIIREVNSGESSWTAGYNKRFHGMSLEDARKMLGARPTRFSTLPRLQHNDTVAAPPASFDSRQKWPSCIHPIRDQAQCGSCWAFGATESLSDRFCIAGGANVVLSPQDLVSCDSSNYGCQGGYLDLAWQYMEQTGVPSDSCYPYTSEAGDVAPCKSSCSDGSTWKVYKAKSTYSLKGVADIQTDIMTNGPVEVAFDVYQDFFSYKSGVYTHKSGGLAGGHAVKLLGWGTLNSVDYWLVANSWGTTWGMNGFFMIKRGVDECGIEDNVVSGLPAV